MVGKQRGLEQVKVKGGDVIKKKGSKDIMRSYMKFTKKNDMEIATI